ncbi:hypothetical protein ACIQU6_44965 [Streptomyces sp. NPDC090442]|uniref:hypothetical protein n=1 Tax=Streptomyces sp. NPDC090442 TaxID=3365962 RepID=UPI003822DF96
MWRLTCKWAKHSHPNKSRNWVVTRYFGQFDRFRQDKWVFGDRPSGLFLRRFAWTPIVRHRMVPGTASPNDPALADFWTTRHRRSKPLLDPVNCHPAALPSARRPLSAMHPGCDLSQVLGWMRSSAWSGCDR